MKLFLMAALIMTLMSCKSKLSYNLDEMPNDGMLLTKWKVLGPFTAKDNQHFLNKDNLIQFGFNEASITYNEFANIRLKDKTLSFKNLLIDSSSYKIDFNRLFGYTESSNVSGNVYCACILKSSKKRKLKLNFSSDDGSKIWLNQHLIYQSDATNGIKYYDKYLDLNIEKGDNLLFIKVNNRSSKWEMFAAIEEETKERYERFKRTFWIEFGRHFLQRSTIGNDSLALNENLPKEKYEVVLSNNKGEKRLFKFDSSGNQFFSISDLPDGLYTATLFAHNDTFNEKLYKGNIVDSINLIIKKLKISQCDSDAIRNIGALKHRYSHIQKPENIANTFPKKRDWDKKMIALFENLSFYANSVTNDQEQTGGAIKTYVSEIDNGIQYYQIFVPKNYKKDKPLPLIIEMPKFMNWHASPLETARFANIRLFELFEELANKYQMIILDPGCRTINKSNMNTIDEADLWENLTAVRKLYAIDTTRIYLRGACLSSRSALKLAVKYPDKFAAISLTAPEIVLSTTDNIWLQQNEPINYLANITNLPVLDIHSKIDTHSPFEESEKLYKAAVKAGFKNFTLKKLPMEFKEFYSEEYLDDVFNFFSKYSIQSNPKEIYFSTSQLKYNKSFWIILNEIVSGKNAKIHARINRNVITVQKENIKSYTIDLKFVQYPKDQVLTIIDNGKKVYEAIPETNLILINMPQNQKGITKNNKIEGPFAHLFNQSFIVVTGTIGSKTENIQIKALADTINNSWKSRYYSGCKIKPDSKISQEDISRSNLLLLGNAESNLLIKKWHMKLPCKVSKSHVTMGDNSVAGEELGFYFVYPNPLNSKRYVAVIGYNNPLFISLGYEEDGWNSGFDDISNYGWFDYKIWNAKTSKNLLSGYFNQYWK